MKDEPRMTSAEQVCSGGIQLGTGTKRVLRGQQIKTKTHTHTPGRSSTEQVAWRKGEYNKDRWSKKKKKERLWEIPGNTQNPAWSSHDPNINETSKWHDFKQWMECKQIECIWFCSGTFCFDWSRGWEADLWGRKWNPSVWFHVAWDSSDTAVIRSMSPTGFDS